MFDFLKRPKIYKQKIFWGKGYEEWMLEDWKKISSILKRDGFKIEVVKFKSNLFGSTIYYKFVKEDGNENV